MPLSVAVCTGTPMTGTTVCAAIMPGRCAAPPAPAMITSMPRPAAAHAYSAISVGVRCADTTRFSCGTPKRVSISSASRIVSQSDLLPMITATSSDVPDTRVFQHIETKDTKDTEQGWVWHLSESDRIEIMKRAVVLFVLLLAAPA